MSVKIMIPTPLRAYTKGQDEVEIDQEGTVGELLTALVTQYTDLKDHLYQDETSLRKYVNIYLGDEDIRYLDHQNTPIKDGQTLSIVPSIAGGY
ncbi:MAG: molybdopterin synthase sulfur carrier subunit [Actinobacteria bacterium]|nr:molybdopterin synthase sulfur carrier subunit [Actinomycetota bacterium]